MKPIQENDSKISFDVKGLDRRAREYVSTTKDD